MEQVDSTPDNQIVIKSALHVFFIQLSTIINLKLFIMKKVFVANKNSYGSEFYNECETLDELKRAIVAHEYQFSKEPVEYSEEVFNEIAEYTMYEIDLHDEERIQWSGYDGTSWFRIERKVSNLLSTAREIKGE